MEAAASAAAPADVLAFWFGGDLDENYRTKWFPSSDGDGSRQRAADERIAATFGATLRDAERGALDAWAEASPEHAVALVVVLDQFSRHIYRHDPDRDEKVARCDEKAVGVVDACVTKRWDARVAAPQQVFLLMPYRHTQSSVARLRVAMERLDARLAAHASVGDLVEKFRKTTLRCLQDSEGKTYADGDEILERSEFAVSAATARTMRDTPLYRTVVRFLQRTLLGAVDSSVAERRRPRRKKDTRSAGSSSRLNDDDAAAAAPRASSGTTAATVVVEPKTKTVVVEPKRRAPVVPSLGISLSGGVDSMVLATILKDIADGDQISGGGPFGAFGVVAMHVDYANRPESRAEAAFLEDWCGRHGMELTTHRMDDTVRRGNTPREEYELMTRSARYDLYKRCRDRSSFPAVLVGHHAGDVRENVIANVFRGAHLLSVNGMREEGIVEGVRVWRPMLPHEKQDVLAFAHAYGVPYFKDTTPKWSTRGKLRNQLQPLLAEMFGAGYERNLSVLGQDSEQLGEMFESFAMAEFDARLKISDLGAYVDLDGFQRKPMLFWKEATRRVCHGLGAGAMTEKSARELIDRITVHDRRSRLRDGWITLKKTNRFFVQGTTLGAFAAGVFPERRDARVSSDPNKRKKKTTGTEEPSSSKSPDDDAPPPPAPPGFGASVALGNAMNAWGPVTRVGAWTVRAREIPNVGIGASALANAEPVDVWRVLRNEIDYLAPAPRKPGGRVYLRPGARLPQFRSVDVTVTGAIPFAVVDVEGAPPDPGEAERDASPATAAAAAAEAYRVKTWPASALAGDTCVEVRVRFARAKTRSEQELASDDASSGDRVEPEVA